MLVWAGPASLGMLVGRSTAPSSSALTTRIVLRTGATCVELDYEYIHIE